MSSQTLGEACSRLSSGKSIPSNKVLDKGLYPVIGGNGRRGFTNSYNFEGSCAVIGRQGAACGNVHYFSGKGYMTEHAVVACAANGNDSHYLAYLLSTMNLGRLSGQSAQPGLSVRTLSKQSIDLPSLKKQRQVVELLGSLDEKIEVNTRANGYLEELLLNRYDEVFGSMDKTFDGTIADIGEVIGGATPSKKMPGYFTNRGIGWITPRDLSNTSDKFIDHGAVDITQTGYDSCSVRMLPAGSVLFSSRAPIGYVAIAAGDLTTNQGFKSVVPLEGIGSAFVYCFLKRNSSRIADAGSGTTFPEVSGKTMKSIPLTLPDMELCAEFTEWSKPLLEQQRSLESETRSLKRLRDALLPKLMSGEIDVSKVEVPTLPNSHLCER